VWRMRYDTPCTCQWNLHKTIYTMKPREAAVASRDVDRWSSNRLASSCCAAADTALADQPAACAQLTFAYDSTTLLVLCYTDSTTFTQRPDLTELNAMAQGKSGGQTSTAVTRGGRAATGGTVGPAGGLRQRRPAGERCVLTSERVQRPLLVFICK
jgi:hypothetical protein